MRAALLFPHAEHVYASLFTDSESFFMRYFLTPLGSAVRWCSHPSLHDVESFKTSLDGTWFLPAEQHVAESLVAIPLCLFLLRAAWGKLWVFGGGASARAHREARKKRESARSQGRGAGDGSPISSLCSLLFPGGGLLDTGAKVGARPFPRVREESTIGEFLDKFVFWGLAATFVHIAACKVWTGRTIFMLMPCHLLTSTLLYLHAAPRSTSSLDRASLVFNHYISYTFMPVLAVAFPDLRDYKLPFETFSFFAQHAFMIASPILFIVRRKFPVLTDSRVPTAAYGFGSLVFFCVLVPVSIVAGVNLNYMLSPPPGILSKFGRMYRPVQMVLCTILLILSNVAHSKAAGGVVDFVSPVAEGSAVSGRDAKLAASASSQASSSRSTARSMSRDQPLNEDLMPDLDQILRRRRAESRANRAKARSRSRSPSAKSSSSPKTSRAKSPKATKRPAASRKRSGSASPRR